MLVMSLHLDFFFLWCQNSFAVSFSSGDIGFLIFVVICVGVGFFLFLSCPIIFFFPTFPFPLSLSGITVKNAV